MHRVLAAVKKSVLGVVFSIWQKAMAELTNSSFPNTRQRTKMYKQIVKSKFIMEKIKMDKYKSNAFFRENKK